MSGPLYPGFSPSGDIDSSFRVVTLNGRAVTAVIFQESVPSNVQVKASAYTAAAGDCVLAGASGGAFTVTLPAATSGRRVTVKKTDSSSNAVTIGGTVDGVVNPTLVYQNQSVELIADGTSWQRMVRQSLATGIVDWPATADTRFGRNYWGQGTDGALDLDGTNSYTGITKSGSTYTLTRDVHATTFRLRSGSTLKPAGFKIYATVSIAWDSGSIVNYDGVAGNANGTITTVVQGTLQQSAGTAAGTGAGTAAGNAWGFGGAGGAGGAGASGGANAGGAATTINGAIGTVPSTQLFRDPLLYHVGTANYTGQVRVLGGGAGGSSGGGDGTNKGGAGGHPGGAIVLFSPSITIAGTVSAVGGNGGSPTTGIAGGGGGGGGGCLIGYSLAAWDLTGATITLTGGTGGTAIGAGGVNGGNGTTGNSQNYVLV